MGSGNDDQISGWMPSQAQWEGVVAREIEGELILAPLAVGVGDVKDALYTLNGTRQAIWKRLDG